MTRIGAFLRIVLSVILLLFPLGFLSYYIIKYSQKIIVLMSKKIDEVRQLDTMKQSILEDANTETEIEKELQTPVFSMIDPVNDDISPLEAPIIGQPTYTVEQESVQKDIAQRQKKVLEKIKYEALLSKEKGRIDEFEKKLVEGLAIDSENLEFHQMLADLYFTLGNYKKALTLLKKIIEIEPQDHKAIWQIGEIYLSKGEFETAELLIEKSIEMKPSNPKYHISMVEVYYNTDRKDHAIVTLEKVIKLRPANVPYLLALADLYAEVQDIENAQRYYFRVLEYEPSNAKAKARLQKIV